MQNANLEAHSLQHHMIRIGHHLLLLGHRNRDPVLRAYVCESLHSLFTGEEWIVFCPQLVQALKWDILDDNALIRLLFTQSIRDKRFAYTFYWQLQVFI